MRIMLLFYLSISLYTATLLAKPGPKAPIRAEGNGPYSQLILRGATLINGEGAPPFGPVDIEIRENKITKIVSVGYPNIAIDPARRPALLPDGQELDLSGQYVLPGFVDMHGHIGGSADNIPAEYVFKLWLAHGITTVREPGSFNGLNWVLDHEQRSADNTITAPRIIPYLGFGIGLDHPITTPEQATNWVKQAAKQGAKGIKLFGANKEILTAALTTAKALKIGSAMHHAQLNVVANDVLDSARLGLTTMEHWYGLPEALFTERQIQNYPADYNYNNEQHRFAQAGRLWQQAAAPDSPRWQQVRDELIALDFTLNPTMTIYEASRDLMRERHAPWHEAYTLPTLWQFFQPSYKAHGSYWFDWTTENEIVWKKNFQLWMQFLNDYKNHGGRVTTGSDSGYIYKIYGFGYVRELELLQEAGFHPLEVIQAATLNGAQALGLSASIGSVTVGKYADLVITTQNPLQNFKILYGTGHERLAADNTLETVHGVRYTIKDGIVFDSQQLLADVRAMVAQAKEAP